MPLGRSWWLFAERLNGHQSFDCSESVQFRLSHLPFRPSGICFYLFYFLGGLAGEEKSVLCSCLLSVWNYLWRNVTLPDFVSGLPGSRWEVSVSMVVSFKLSWPLFLLTLFWECWGGLVGRGRGLPCLHVGTCGACVSHGHHFWW